MLAGRARMCVRARVRRKHVGIGELARALHPEAV